MLGSMYSEGLASVGCLLVPATYTGMLDMLAGVYGQLTTCWTRSADRGS